MRDFEKRGSLCVSIKLRRRDEDELVHNSDTNDSVFRLADWLGFPYYANN